MPWGCVMSGSDYHCSKAEELLDELAKTSSYSPGVDDLKATRAQAHATLALARSQATVAQQGGPPGRKTVSWDKYSGNESEPE